MSFAQLARPKNKKPTMSRKKEKQVRNIPLYLNVHTLNHFHPFHILGKLNEPSHVVTIRCSASLAVNFLCRSGLFFIVIAGTNQLD